MKHPSHDAIEEDQHAEAIDAGRPYMDDDGFVCECEWCQEIIDDSYCEFCLGPKGRGQEMCDDCAADKAANPEEWR